VIRKNVGWYALLFQLGKGQIFIARRNPDVIINCMAAWYFAFLKGKSAT
jgi:hypothetical protein